MEKRRILLDANFLMLPAQYGIDIFSEIDRICTFPYELAVVQLVIYELQGIAKSKGKDGDRARLALALLKNKSVAVVDNEREESKTIKNADEFMLAIVRRDRDIVCTQDKELRRALREKGIATIVLRKRRVLEIQW